MLRFQIYEMGGDTDSSCACFNWVFTDRDHGCHRFFVSSWFFTILRAVSIAHSFLLSYTLLYIYSLVSYNRSKFRPHFWIFYSQNSSRQFPTSSLRIWVLLLPFALFSDWMCTKWVLKTSCWKWTKKWREIMYSKKGETQALLNIIFKKFGENTKSSI